MACSPTEKPTGLELARGIAAAYADGLSKEDCKDLGISQDCELYQDALEPPESQDGKIESYQRRKLKEAGRSDEFIDELESKAFPARVDWLSDKITSFWVSNRRRQELIGELGKFGGLVQEDAISDLIELAGDDNSKPWYCGAFDYIRNSGRFALGSWASDLDFERCVSLQGAAVMALGDVGPNAKEAIPLLRRMARADNSGRSREAITALGGIRAGEAVPDIVELGETAYAKINADLITKWLFGEIWGRFKNILPKWAFDMQPRWREMSSQEDRYLIYVVIQALGEIGARPEIAVPFLAKLMDIELDDRQMEDSTRKNSIEAVDKFGLEGIRMATPVLVKRLNDSPSISVPAVEALAKLGDEIVPKMLEVIRDRGPRTYVSRAIHVLEKTGPSKEKVVSVLLEVLANIEGKYYDFERADAAKALGDIGTPDAAIPFLRLAMLAKGEEESARSNAADLRGAAVYALGVADSVGDLMAALEDEDEGVRNAATEKLGAMGSKAIDRYYDQPMEEALVIPRPEPWEGDVPPAL